MGRAASILVSLAVAATAYAEVEVRIWVTDEPPEASFGGPIAFTPGYGPFTPFTVRDNGWPGYPQLYDVHRHHVDTGNPGSVTTPKFTPAQIPQPEEPSLPGVPGERLYIWGAFCGPGLANPIKPGLGWEIRDVRVQGLNLRLVTTGNLILEPHWYQYEKGSTSTTTSETRWADTSDMTGHEVTVVGLGMGSPSSTGWYAGTTTERMQTWALDSAWGGSGDYGAGGILLGAVKRVNGCGNLFIGLGRNGISSTDESGVIFFPGTEEEGIVARVVPEGSPPRIGQTPEATWLPEPAGLWLLAISVAALRRRRPRA